MPYFSSGQSQLYYEVHGSGPTMVLLHGMGGNHASWFPQIAGLADRFRLITVDARGFGKSVDVEGLGRDGFVDDLDNLWRALDLRRAVLVGQSMGGGCCVLFACRYPERVSGLVLADTLIGIELPTSLQAGMDAILRATANLGQAERVLGSTTRAGAPDKVALYGQIASFNSVGLRTLTGTQRARPLDDLVAARMPILFVVGSEDILFPPPLVEAVQKRIPSSQLHVIPDAGHSAHFESPQAFNDILETWHSSLLIEAPTSCDR